MPSPLTDAFAWVVVLAFLGSVALQWRSERAARAGAATSWLLFAAFWAVMAPHFAFGQKSYVEGLLSAAAVPACAYAGYLVWTRRPSLLLLSRAVAFMGLIYLPFETWPLLERLTVETVTYHTAGVAEALGYDPIVETGDRTYPSKIAFVAPSGHTYSNPVLVACSGIGSISIMTGLVMAVRAPLGRRLATVAILAPLIYGLNLVRATFIVLAHGHQWFRGVFTEQVLLAFGSSNPRMVSYYLADRVIAQSLSVVVLVVLTLALLRVLPQLSTFVEEAAYVVTGREYDVRTRFGTDPPAATDGGDASR